MHQFNIILYDKFRCDKDAWEDCARNCHSSEDEFMVISFEPFVHTVYGHTNRNVARIFINLDVCR